MVITTMSYCCEIWGIYFLKEFNDLQANFYKKLFWLANSCSIVAVRVEYRLRTSSVSILKRALNWIEKVNGIEDKRLPKTCLKKLVRKKKAKYNWYY